MIWEIWFYSLIPIHMPQFPVILTLICHM